MLVVSELIPILVDLILGGQLASPWLIAGEGIGLYDMAYAIPIVSQSVCPSSAYSDI